MNLRLQEEKWLKEKFLRAVKESREAGHPDEVYTFQMLQALRDMAREDVWPDGHFSDNDCNIWGMFHGFQIRKEEG